MAFCESWWAEISDGRYNGNPRCENRAAAFSLVDRRRSRRQQHGAVIRICLSARIEVPQVAQNRIAWNIRSLFGGRTFGGRSNAASKRPFAGELYRSWNRPGRPLTFPAGQGAGE